MKAIVFVSLILGQIVAIALPRIQNIRLVKAGIYVSLDSATWKKEERGLSSANGYDLVLTRIGRADNHRFIQTSFDSGDHCDANEIKNIGPAIKISKIKTLAGYQCVFSIGSSNATQMIAVKKIEKLAGKKRTPFVRYVTFVEENPKSAKEFMGWLASVREFP